MTKKEALQIFKESELPYIVEAYGPQDKPAIREAWNNFTDMLCKDGEITLKQYETWVHPF